MKKILIITAINFMLLIPVSKSIAESDVAPLLSGPSFKAQMKESNLSNPNMFNKSEVRMSKHGMRVITKGPGGQKMVMLTTKEDTFILLPAQHKYISTTEIEEQADNTGDDGPIELLANKPCLGFTKSKKASTTKVAGREVTKWYCGNAKGLDDTVHYFDSSLQRVIKVQQPDGTVLELVNIEQKPQDRKLFEIPPGYKKMTFREMLTPPGMNLEPFTDEKK